MIIKNADIFTGDGSFKKGNLHLQGAYIESVEIEEQAEQIGAACEGEEIIDAEGLYVIPGLIDTHIHGCNGHDFCEGTKEALDCMCNHLATQGITAFLPTSMSLGENTLSDIFKHYGEYTYSGGALPVGIHMEGPFFDAEKKGAQNGNYLKTANTQLFRHLQELSNNGIKVVSVSPAADSKGSFIEEVKEEVAISLAHTGAKYELASEAFKKGAKRVTHLYNAMLPFSHREPAVVGAAFDHKETMVELICDGVHVHPSMIRSTFAMFTDERIILVSDNMMAAGMPDGSYELGGQKVEVKGNKALLENGTIAGSVTNLMNCLRKAVEFGIPLESAIKAATINPAKSIGIEDKMGSLEAGKLANVVLLDKDLQIKAVIINGKKVQ